MPPSTPALSNNSSKRDRIPILDTSATIEEQADQEQYRSSTRSSEIPMGPPGEAYEQASAIAFLASHDASYITGQVLAVGGGQPYPF